MLHVALCFVSVACKTVPVTLAGLIVAFIIFCFGCLLCFVVFVSTLTQFIHKNLFYHMTSSLGVI